jgi:hypothetical protein
MKSKFLCKMVLLYRKATEWFNFEIRKFRVVEKFSFAKTTLWTETGLIGGFPV